jgi:hypothetical protein
VPRFSPLRQRSKRSAPSSTAGDAGAKAGWPEAMRLELQACRTPQERVAWTEKWSKYLSGQMQREEAEMRRRRLMLEQCRPDLH